MGSLFYDRTAEFEIDDRSLAHPQVVILNKAATQGVVRARPRRRHQARDRLINESTPLEFPYVGNRRPVLNQLWLETMAGEAGLNGLLRLTPEPRTAEG